MMFTFQNYGLIMNQFSPGQLTESEEAKVIFEILSSCQVPNRFRGHKS